MKTPGKILAAVLCVLLLAGLVVYAFDVGLFKADAAMLIRRRR